MQDEPLELIAIVYSQNELALLTSRLRWESIWSFCHSERQVGMDPGLTLAFGGIRLFVHRDDAETARSLIAETSPWDRHCGVYDRSPVMDWVLALFLTVLTGVSPPARLPHVPVSRVERIVA